MAGVSITAGSDVVDLTMPHPAGSVPVRLGGRRSVLTTPTWAPGAAGFDVDATAGAARITVTTQAG